MHLLVGYFWLAGWLLACHMPPSLSDGHYV
jgi:hypothetical protein